MIPRLNHNFGCNKIVRRSEDEPQVQNGLAVTPSEMLELSQQGIPVTPQNLGLGYQEGVSDLDFEPPLQYRRGIDIADLYEARERSKAKVKKAISNPSNFEQKGVD